MREPNRPELAELRIGDPPERWAALGFAVKDDTVQLGAIVVRLGAPGHGITSWAIREIPAPLDIDGLSTTPASGSSPPQEHPNGATGIDHVVVVTPDFERTEQALVQAGLPLRRIRDASGFRQGFRRLGPAILELVEARAKDAPPGPARFWGLVVTVEDLDALAVALGDRLGKLRPAVQPGRRIATLRESAGLSAAVAFMTPES